MNRPRRERKDDPLLHPVQSRRTVQIDYAIAPFDEAAIAMDQKWGRDKLQTLVTPETAAKYGSAMHKLYDAIRDNDAGLVEQRAAVCVRGLQAMDAEATRLGKQPASDEIFLLHTPDRQIGILRDAAGYEAAKRKYPDIDLVSEQEVIYALKKMERKTEEKIKETLG